MRGHATCDTRAYAPVLAFASAYEAFNGWCSLASGARRKESTCHGILQSVEKLVVAVSDTKTPIAKLRAEDTRHARSLVFTERDSLLSADYLARCVAKLYLNLAIFYLDDVYIAGCEFVNGICNTVLQL